MNLRSLVLLGALLSFALLAPRHVSAQASGPDIRDIRPVIMLMIDTSGSMERYGNCVCTTPQCTECVPAPANCAAANPNERKNRWANVLEALTGTFDNYVCSVEDRVGTGVASGTSYVGEYDEFYYLPHVVQPVGTAQANDGLLDFYVDRIKFGLMTFDSVPTLTGELPLVHSSQWTNSFINRSRSAEGMWSYGNEPDPAPDVQDHSEESYFGFENCTNPPYVIDVGARNETATAGRLVSVGTDSADHVAINDSIQNALLSPGLRPYGATPVAGMLHDLIYYFNNHEDVREASSGNDGDRFFECRERYAVLLTDGYPNADMRGEPYYCENDTSDNGCPYAPAEESALRLKDEGYVDGLYVVGFEVGALSGLPGPAATRAAEAIARLNTLAANGGTDEAVFVSGPDQLRTALADIFDQAQPGTSTRTVPAFGSPSVASGSGTVQMQFNTGFRVGGSDANNVFTPWSGVLERRRFSCNSANEIVEEEIDASDRFHELLENQNNRTLYTVVPGTGGDPNGTILGDGANDLRSRGLSIADADNDAPTIPGAQRDRPLVALSTANVSAGLLGVSSSTEAGDVIEWMHGGSGSARAGQTLGAINNSSPIVVGPPSSDIADETYNRWRDQVEIGQRPTVVYVGSNDGIFHAFMADDYTHPSNGATYVAGQELWGFVPPFLLDQLEGLDDGPQWMIDGAPIVRDVFDVHTGSGDEPESYHTVMIVGLRAGGASYFALDVSDPFNPVFLWQFTDPNLGDAYGTPATAQVAVRENGVIEERGVVIIPGGLGSTSGTGSCPAPSGFVDQVDATGARGSVQCWNTAGRGLFVVDMYTGELLRRFDDATLTAPVTGGVAPFLGSTGQIATRAFFSDADGILWRLDLSDADPADWELDPFFDMYFGQPYDAGELSYFPPIVSVDESGNPVIIQGTGNADVLDQPDASNVIASVTELLEFDTSDGSIDTIRAERNWRYLLDAGEQVTGPLDIFEGAVFFSTFVTAASGSNACDFGFSRIYAGDYLEAATSTEDAPAPRFDLDDNGEDEALRLDPTETPANFDMLHNRLIMGIRVTARPSCVTSGTDSTDDPYFASRVTQRATSAGAPQFQLVGQVSGGSGAAAAGGSVQEFSYNLPSPDGVTELSSYAGSVD